jgi:hypothetical protein
LYVSCRLFIVNTTFEVTSTPTRPVENVVRPTGKKHTNVGWGDCGK